MAIFPSNGTKIFLSTAGQNSEPADAAAYGALSYTEIKETESIDTFGDTSNKITFASLADARTHRVKGTRDAGVLDLVLGLDYADAGQNALRTAEGTEHNYAFKVVFDDAPPAGTPSERYFIAQVGSAAEQVDSADSVLKLNSQLWINSAVTAVSAA
ncbi:hypothetical protein RUESEDTHA_00837 [Ruegeria sp. THAF57]|uniref:hypothetical protein n=1 Tax=Ruegeria sp. THAF57 TaxID=2744555 RepID=UPI0015DF3E85|nr:hypothetical protein [Ruegeria sp. THAF57]CAD0183960.1 hypothetical protein RUESEDTHA_00837 [Ruegeria sp. THAF57]